MAYHSILLYCFVRLNAENIILIYTIEGYYLLVVVRSYILNWNDDDDGPSSIEQLLMFGRRA